MLNLFVFIQKKYILAFTCFNEFRSRNQNGDPLLFDVARSRPADNDY